ncbi:hypothetical protein Tco_0343802 [Tanacetum coccineum]
MLETQRSVKDKTDLRLNEYSVVPPPLAQAYSSPMPDLSWTSLLEFADNIVTDYTRPTPSVDVTNDVRSKLDGNNLTVCEHGGTSSNAMSKPIINFVKESSCPSASKVNNTENSRKPIMKWMHKFRGGRSATRVAKAKDKEEKQKCMRTRNSNFPNNSNVTILRRRNKGRAPNIVEPELHTIVEVTPMAEHTMEELLRAPTERYGEAIVLPKINADHFEIKTNLLQLVQANPFHGLENENPHAHINSFKRITSTPRFRNVPNDVIKLMMFPYLLEGAAKTCEAWERFKEMLRACPHHRFMELTQIDTFYNGLNDNDQDSLNAASGGNLLSKTTREALNIIENKSKVRYSRNKPNASRINSTSKENASKTDERIDKLTDQLLTSVEIVSIKVVTPALVKRVEETCVTCGCAHSWYNCLTTNNNQASVCATMGAYNQVAPQNRVSNQIAQSGFTPVQNNGQNRFNQNQCQGNNFNQGNNFHGNQGFQAQNNHAPNFQNQGFQNQPFQVPNNQVQQEFSNELSSYKRNNDQIMRNMQNQINSLKGDLKNEIQNTIKSQQAIMMNQQTTFQNNLQNMICGLFKNQA